MVAGCAAVVDMKGEWVADPTGRCDFRYRLEDGTYTDEVSNRGVKLLDPWGVATRNRRPVEPWPVGARYCYRCKRGAVPGEQRCTRCGLGFLTVKGEQQAREERQRSNRKTAWVLAAFVLTGGALLALVAATDTQGPGGVGTGAARDACDTFRQGVLSAAGGTSTSADADRALAAARRSAQNAAGLNGEYRQLLVLLTSVANGREGAGLSVLDECHRLGL